MSNMGTDFRACNTKHLADADENEDLLLLLFLFYYPLGAWGQFSRLVGAARFLILILDLICIDREIKIFELLGKNTPIFGQPHKSIEYPT